MRIGKNSEQEPTTIFYADPDSRGTTVLAMRCPECGEAYGFHIDGIEIANAAGQKLVVEAKGEDEDSNLSLMLENHRGKEKIHDGRRHRISLLAWCEHCGDEFSLNFKQHKGTTYYTRNVVGSATPLRASAKEG